MWHEGRNAMWHVSMQAWNRRKTRTRRMPPSKIHIRVFKHACMHACMRAPHQCSAVHHSAAHHRILQRSAAQRSAPHHRTAMHARTHACMHACTHVADVRRRWKWNSRVLGGRIRMVRLIRRPLRLVHCHRRHRRRYHCFVSARDHRQNGRAQKRRNPMLLAYP